MEPARLPKHEVMPAQRRTPHRRCLEAIATAALVAAALAGCGTPAVIKPVSVPLPGLQRDIRAARNAVAVTEAQAQAAAAATGATLP